MTKEKKGKFGKYYLITQSSSRKILYCMLYAYNIIWYFIEFIFYFSIKSPFIIVFITFMQITVVVLPISIVYNNYPPVIILIIIPMSRSINFMNCMLHQLLLQPLSHPQVLVHLAVYFTHFCLIGTGQCKVAYLLTCFFFFISLLSVFNSRFTIVHWLQLRFQCNYCFQLQIVLMRPKRQPKHDQQ